MPENNRPLMASQVIADDVELTEAEQKELVELRGGCSCFVNPPCSTCSKPATMEELIRLGIVIADHQ